MPLSNETALTDYVSPEKYKKSQHTLFEHFKCSLDHLVRLGPWVEHLSFKKVRIHLQNTKTCVHSDPQQITS